MVLQIEAENFVKRLQLTQVTLPHRLQSTRGTVQDANAEDVNEVLLCLYQDICLQKRSRAGTYTRLRHDTEHINQRT